MLIRTVHVAFTHLYRGHYQFNGSAPGLARHSVSRFHPGIATTAAITGQIANRSAKSDRLPTRQAKPQVNDNAPAQVPTQIAPNPKLKTDCKPPIDVLGRCFAGARANQNIA